MDFINGDSLGIFLLAGFSGFGLLTRAAIWVGHTLKSPPARGARIYDNLF